MLSGRIPAHSAESRRTILRISTPTRPQVLRGDGHPTRTAPAATRPRPRARGRVRVWTGLGAHRNSISRHPHSAGNIRWPEMCWRLGPRWMRTAMLAWTATQCRLYARALPFCSHTEAHLLPPLEQEGALPHEEHLAPSVDSRQTSEQNLYHPIPVAPHHAPPLHQHLAGSPQAQQDQPPPPSRPPSATSSGAALAQSQLGAASFGLAGPIDWSQQPASVLLGAEDSAMMMDDSTAGARKQSGGTAGGGGGWKVTMGYRADCIKCLQRVPGHYSHVVPT